MANETTTPHETILRDTFRRMDGDRHQQIRDAYYKAVAGLLALEEALLGAEEPTGESFDAMSTERMVVCNAIKALEKSVLGRIL